MGEAELPAAPTLQEVPLGTLLLDSDFEVAVCGNMEQRGDKLNRQEFLEEVVRCSYVYHTGRAADAAAPIDIVREKLESAFIEFKNAVPYCPRCIRTNILWYSPHESRGTCLDCEYSVSVGEARRTGIAVLRGEVATQDDNSTPEEQEHRQARAAEYHARNNERIRIRALADQRAEALLLRCLPPEIREHYLSASWVRVPSRMYKDKVYRIERGSVKLVDKVSGVQRVSYCIHPPCMVAAADTMLAQFLMIVTDEERFQRDANASILVADNSATQCIGDQTTGARVTIGQ